MKAVNLFQRYLNLSATQLGKAGEKELEARSINF